MSNLSPVLSAPNLDFLLFLAVKRNDIGDVRRILSENGICGDEQSSSLKWTAVQIAIVEGHWDIFNVLLDAGCDVSRANPLGWTPLLFACHVSGRLEFAKRLLSEGANVNCSDPGVGWGPLHWAVSRRDQSLLRLLLSHGANPSQANREYRTPLHFAVQSQWRKGTEILIRTGSDPNYRDREGFSPFYYTALCFNDVQVRHKILSLMLASGADLSLEYWATAKNEDLYTGIDVETLKWLDGAREFQPLPLRWLCRIGLRACFSNWADEKCEKLCETLLPTEMKKFLLLESS